MKKITLYATTVITVGLLCYLGLSGYVWYYDKQRSKKSDVQASVVGENNKILGYFREKGCDIVIRLPLNYLFIPLFRWQSS